MSDATGTGTEITFAEARERILSVLDADPHLQFGGVSAEGCTYFECINPQSSEPTRSLTPNCAVGRAFSHELAPIVTEYCHDGTFYVNGLGIDKLAEEHAPHLFSEEAVTFLSFVQDMNDHGFFSFRGIADEIRRMFPSPTEYPEFKDASEKEEAHV